MDFSNFDNFQPRIEIEELGKFLKNQPKLAFMDLFMVIYLNIEDK